MSKVSIIALATNFADFLGKHSGELRLVGSTLETIIGALPIDAQDKARISEAVAALQTSAGNIAAGAQKLSDLANSVAGDAAVETDVVVSRQDVEAAVHDELVSEGIISGHGEAGNVSAPGTANG